MCVCMCVCCTDREKKGGEQNNDEQCAPTVAAERTKTVGSVVELHVGRHVLCPNPGQSRLRGHLKDPSSLH